MRLRVHPKAIAKMKSKAKEHTQRNNRYGNEKRIDKLKRYIRGWINYFKMSDMKQLLIKTDEWMRRRIRMVYWRVSSSPILSRSLGNQTLKDLGYLFYTDYYRQVSVK